jgi:hypothetical protein
MYSLPLLPGKTTPEHVEKTLSVLGNNPHGEPNYRLIWSERKQIHFFGEIVPEYTNFDPPCWVLEAWVDPVTAAGPQAYWSEMLELTMGPYPRHGVYFLSQMFTSDWYPSDEVVRVLAIGLQKSKDVAMADRLKAIKEGLQEKERAGIQKTADAIVELQDSASLGKIQQAASGPKNNFRTPEDFERDQERIGRISHKEYAHLPKRGGKILR